MPASKPRSRLWSTLPDRIFVSYSYDDEADKDRLLGLLPRRVRANAFPFCEPDPRDAVSNGIVEKIRDCGGLIFLESDRSRDSLWVNFERDYARRSGLKVYGFDAKAGKLRRDTRGSVPLRIELVVSEDDLHRARRLIEWMRTQRSFKFPGRSTHLRMKEIAGFVAGLIHEEQIVVWLMDDHVGAIAEHALELPVEDLYYAYCGLYDAFHEYDESDFEEYAAWLGEHSMYVRLNAEWRRKESDDPDVREFIDSEYGIERAFHRRWAVDLVSRANEQEIDWNRADDLIVRTTYMLRQSTPFLPEIDA